MSILQTAVKPAERMIFPEFNSILQRGGSIREAVETQFRVVTQKAAQQMGDYFQPLAGELRAKTDEVLSKLGIQAEDHLYREAPVSIHSPSQKKVSMINALRNMGELFRRGEYTVVGVVKHPSPQQMQDDLTKIVELSQQQATKNQYNPSMIRQLTTINGVEVLHRKFSQFGIEFEHVTHVLDDTHVLQVAKMKLGPNVRKAYDSVIGMLDSLKILMEKVKPAFVQKWLAIIEKIALNNATVKVAVKQP